MEGSELEGGEVMAKEYPKGAIRTINELLEYRGKKLYHVSRVFCKEGVTSYTTETFTGRIGTKHYPEDRFGSESWYDWYEVRHEGMNHTSRHSLVDANVIENGYNDWYLFPNRADAEDFLKG
jgi:hypothetical protein